MSRRQPEVVPDNPYLTLLDAEEEERDPDAIDPTRPAPRARRSRYAPVEGHLVERGHFSRLPVEEGAGGWRLPMDEP